MNSVSKKQLTAYMIYCKDNLMRVRTTNPHFTQLQVITQLNSEWVWLPEEIKNEYITREHARMY